MIQDDNPFVLNMQNEESSCCAKKDPFRMGSSITAGGDLESTEGMGQCLVSQRLF